MAIEVKYAEQGGQSYRRPTDLLMQRAREANFYRDVDEALFRDPHTAQFAAEHLLTYCIRSRMAEPANAAFMVIGPKDNSFVRKCCDSYTATLDPANCDIPFVDVTLEDCIDLIGSTGHADLATALWARYTDFTPVHALIESWEPTAHRTLTTSDRE